MSKYILLSITLIFIFLSQGCKNVDCSLDKIDQYFLKAGSTYSFKMSDENYKPIAEGKIFISNKQRLNISGTYTVDSTYRNDYPGISNMKGEFTAKENEDDNTVTLNTNPKISDKNIIFEFNLRLNKIDGRWYCMTPQGRIAEGILTGIKIK